MRTLEEARTPRDFWWPMGVNPLIDSTTWEQEEEAWNKHVSVWRCVSQTGYTYTRISGPDAERLLSDTVVNKIYGAKPGTIKQLIGCNDDGKIVYDTLCLVMAPGVFEISGDINRISYIMELNGGYDVTIEQVAPRTFIQVAGPDSFKLLQELTDYDLTQIKFTHFNTEPIELAGCDCYLVRNTMTGELGFEIQSAVENGDTIYAAVLEAGRKYGIQRISARNHLVQHMEAGILGFYYSDGVWAICDEGDPYYAYLERIGDPSLPLNSFPSISGSYEPTAWSDFYLSPVDLGMSRYINFDHDFPGKEALAEEVKAPKRKMVCLEWNDEDVVDVYASYFHSGASHERVDAPHYDYMEMPRDPRLPVEASKVLIDGEEVAFTTSRTYMYSFRRMVSNCLMPVEYAEPGREVTVVWGNPGHPQKEIRATVATCPYKPNMTRSLPSDARKK